MARSALFAALGAWRYAVTLRSAFDRTDREYLELSASKLAHESKGNAMATQQVNLVDYNAETNPRRRGDIFEKLVVAGLERQYGKKISTERNIENGTVLDGLSTLDGHPWVIEIKDRKDVMRLGAGTTRVQLPRQLEVALSNSGIYEIIVAPRTQIGNTLRHQLGEIERTLSLRWKISSFDPATGKFHLLYSSKNESAKSS